MSKKEQVKALFNDIAPKYDPLNHILSLGIDKRWRKKAIRILRRDNPQHILDVACGTGDFAITALRLGIPQVTGLDISENMVKVGREKINALGYDQRCDLTIGDSEHIGFATDTFDAVTVAFGVRNFENLEQGLREICRVIKPGHKAIILEFSKPSAFPIKQLYNFYFRHILPTIGGWYSGNRAAYEYLPDSVSKFPQREQFLKILKASGFSTAQQIRLTFGIATIYIAEK